MKIATFWVWVGLFLVAPNAARACSCAAIPSAREAYHKSSLVFFGKVTSVSVKKKTGNYLLDAEVKVTVEKTWKGNMGKSIVLQDKGGDCPAFGFLEGKRYVFYLKQPQGGKSLTVFRCSWIRGEANAKSDLEWLRTLKRHS